MEEDIESKLKCIELAQAQLVGTSTKANENNSNKEDLPAYTGEYPEGYFIDPTLPAYTGPMPGDTTV